VKMRAGDVFLGDYTKAIVKGEAEVPDQAKEGPWALGETIMVSRDSMREDDRTTDCPEWFAAQVCLPRGEGGWYRWYDPYVHFETDFSINIGSKPNYGYVGKKWYRWTPNQYNPGPEPPDWYKPLEYWAYPMGVWRELFGGEDVP